ncbi:lactate dehydrogenase-like 2-hydroxyacid dehydrogenase [Litorimonas taeanensis]|uniref:Lactate dehydrogenase-like 2-hydroxyacid dehydrogenase n=1 Tax=Litorimonas taeanensis TaxID=568099 RepID=A0A420WDL4_9PROT|nr:D-glycerate dehydrogenase [Litorimonas taeanensis]RKQ69045.1 lactate dehydrogenase-like 2-hydroxyacid dehydrogenase [Litorimonas taeanensis]
MRQKPIVRVTRRLPDVIEARLSDLFDARLRSDDTPMSEAELKAAIADCDVFVPTVTDEITKDVINSASDKLKLIANFGAGTDHIDVATAYSKGITVSNTPGVLTEDTADLTLALILAVPRRLVEGDRRMRAGEFEGWSPTHMLGHRVRGKALGIIGMGRIGQAVARRADAFGLSVHYHNRHPVPKGIENSLSAKYWEDLDAMLAAVDIVSVNCPSTPDTHHLIDARRLKLMGPNSYIVNTSRGEVIDESALAAALSAGQIAGAGLDVYEEEPAVNPALLTLPNVILAPHIGSATHESRREMGEKVLINIRAKMDHHACPDRVLPPGARISLAS